MMRPIRECVIFVAVLAITVGFYSSRGSDVDWTGWVVLAVLFVIVRFAVYLLWERRNAQSADLG